MPSSPEENSDQNGGFQRRKGRPDRWQRFKRDADEEKRPRVLLTDFDRKLFQLLDRYRLLDSKQIIHATQRWPLALDGRRKTDSRSKRVILGRLQKLFHAEYLDRPRGQLARRWVGRLQTNHMVYALGYHGHLALHGKRAAAAAERLKNRNRQAHYLEHRVGFSGVLLTMKHAAEDEDVDFDWMDGEDFRRQHDLTQVTVKDREHEYTLPFNPDAFVRLAGNHYFLEFDGGTEPIERSRYAKTSIVRKLRAYSAFFHQDLHYEHNIPGFQVLFVVGPRRAGDTAAESRLLSMLDLAHDVHASRMFLFTTVDRVRLEQPADIVRERIWFSPRNDDLDPIPLLDELAE